VVWLTGVAAAAALVGLLAGRALWRSPGGEGFTTVASTGLRTLDATPRSIGDAEVLREDGHLDLRLDLQARTLASAGGGYFEVWLINRDGQRMVSVGVLAAPADQTGSDVATFPIAQTLLDAGYVVVDVSREAFDDDPTHSGDSLARGTLPL
jgi:hypothetical protein